MTTKKQAIAKAQAWRLAADGMTLTSYPTVERAQAALAAFLADGQKDACIVNTSAPTPKSFWSYQSADETPTLDAAIAANAIAANTTQQQWEALSPGMRREIVRSKLKRAS